MRPILSASSCQTIPVPEADARELSIPSCPLADRLLRTLGATCLVLALVLAAGHGLTVILLRSIEFSLAPPGYEIDPDRAPFVDP